MMAFNVDKIVELKLSYEEADTIKNVLYDITEKVKNEEALEHINVIIKKIEEAMDKSIEDRVEGE